VRAALERALGDQDDGGGDEGADDDLQQQAAEDEPASSSEPTPMSIVSQSGMAWRPGTTARPSAPTTSPMTSRTRCRS
jgi:hypothetical protein